MAWAKFLPVRGRPISRSWYLLIVTLFPLTIIHLSQTRRSLLSVDSVFWLIAVATFAWMWLIATLRFLFNNNLSRLWILPIFLSTALFTLGLFMHWSPFYKAALVATVLLPLLLLWLSLRGDTSKLEASGPDGPPA